MALTGNCTHTVYTAHETETTTETITHFDGTSETVEVPVMIATSTDYTDVYVCIKQVENFNYWSDEQNHKSFIYQYAAYTDVATRNADQEDFLFWDVGTLQSYNPEGNLYAQIYTEIKTIDGLTDLIDA